MSGLEFVYETEENEMDMYKVKERLALTEDDRLVPEDSDEARWLYAIPGQQIPLEEAVRYGLVDGSEGSVEDAVEDDENGQPLDRREQLLAMKRPELVQIAYELGIENAGRIGRRNASIVEMILEAEAAKS